MGQVVSTTQIACSERRHLLLIPDISCLEFCSGLSDPQARRGRARRVTEQKDHHRLRNRRRITVIARCLLFSNLRANLERPALEPSDPLTWVKRYDPVSCRPAERSHRVSGERETLTTLTAVELERDENRIH